MNPIPCDGKIVYDAAALEGARSIFITGDLIPRELSEKEIKTISEKTNAELEAFVHGALCMCYSGQCYF